MLQIEIIRPGLHLLSQSVTGRANLRAQMLQIEMLDDRDRYPARLCGACVVVFQFVIDMRTGEKVCYTLSRCPHRLAAKDATLSRWISRVRIPLGAPQHLSRSRRVFRLGLFSFPRMCAKPVRQMCAKSAENRPEIHREGNGEDPRPHGERPRRGPFNCPARPLGYRFACPFATRLLAPWLPLG